MKSSQKSYLLDTNVLIRLDKDYKRVSVAVLELIANPDSKLWVSTVSFWELAIRHSIRKLESAIRFDSVLKTYGMAELGISSIYTDTVRGLPMVHRDPFDRMLVAQAMVEGMVLVTADRRLAGYPVAVLQV